MQSSKPIPVLATGKTERVGQAVCQLLLPEIEVIHFTLAEAIDSELPLVLRGQLPDNKSTDLAPGSWESGPPVALLLGGAYGDADIERLRHSLGLDAPDAPAAAPAAAAIPWVRIDSNKSTLSPRDPAYPADVVRRFKECLLKLQADGKLGSTSNSSVYAV